MKLRQIVEPGLRPETRYTESGTICGVPLFSHVVEWEEKARGKSKIGAFIDGGWWVCYDGGVVVFGSEIKYICF